MRREGSRRQRWNTGTAKETRKREQKRSEDKVRNGMEEKQEGHETPQHRRADLKGERARSPRDSNERDGRQVGGASKREREQTD